MASTSYKNALAITLCLSQPCLASICTNTSGVSQNINYEISSSLILPNNKPGYSFVLHKNSPGTVQVICPEGTTEEYSLRSYVSNYPISHKNSDGLAYIKLNDYLEAALSITDSVAGTFYPPVEYVKMGEDNGIPKHEYFSVEDHDLIFRFIILKPFVGITHFDKTSVFSVYVTTRNTDPLISEVYSISYSGDIKVPQSCELEAGKIITMDFGNIGASAFTQAGAGNKPAGVNPQTHNIAIHCKNMDAQALLSLRIEANNVSGNAIISNNPDLGFIVADGNKNPLTPNNTDSKIPFQLDANSSASVPVSAWPVSVTGKKPVEGKFTSEGYLRVDFD